MFNNMKEMGFPVASNNAKVYCKVFKDNSGELEIARIPKFSPRTKHLNCRLNQFRSYIDDTKEISIHTIDTLNRPAYFFNNPLNCSIIINFSRWSWGGKY